MTLRYAYEVERRLRVAFLGTSGHAFRNYLPSLPYAAVDLVAVWDANASRAEAFARQFGAQSSYSDLDQLLGHEEPDAVLIGADGFVGDEPLAASLTTQCLQAGCHVWTDKPVAAHVGTVQDLIALRDRVDRIVAVGAKTMHNPAYTKAREIVRLPEFGQPTTFFGRYPLHVPNPPTPDRTDPTVRSCLNHVWHPVGAALLIMGAVDNVVRLAAPVAGGAVALASFANGAVGTFHFSAGQAQTSPLERIEIVGDGSNVVVDNAANLTWYRPGSCGSYGRTPTHITSNDIAPLVWQPELSLGQLYNNNNFLQGYAPSIIAFVEAILTNQPLAVGTLEDAAQILRVFELLVSAPQYPR